MEDNLNTDYKVGELIYDANIYDGLNTFLFDFQFYLNWMPKLKNTKVLELCCGSGRLTIPLAKNGVNISGLDNSITMLAKAKLSAQNAGVKIDFIEADIRNFDLTDKFDLIFIPFNSIHHLYQNQDLFSVLENVKKHLKEGGLFLFDCFNPNMDYIIASEKVKTKIADYETLDGRKIQIEQTMKYENNTQINRIKWHYFINNKFNSIQNMDMRLYFPEELDSYLKSNGFDVLQKFGNFNEEQFSDTSEKQIFVCKKSK